MIVHKGRAGPINPCRASISTYDIHGKNQGLDDNLNNRWLALGGMDITIT